MLDANRTKGGFADLLGYELAEWGEDHAVVTLKVDQRHMNRSGVMHGGVLSTLLDTALGYVGTYTPEGETPKRAFTLSLNCHFIGTVKKGATLTATARRNGGGRSIYFSVCEVTDDEGRLVGSGDGVFKYITLRT